MQGYMRNFTNMAYLAAGEREVSGNNDHYAFAATRTVGSKVTATW
jgi:hypothetical protein